MHGFAQRVLPLLSEPGNKPNGKVSRPSGEYLWQLYQALPDGHKMLMRLKALIDPAIGKGPFHEAVRKAGLRLPDGKVYTGAFLNTQLQVLQHKGLLSEDLGCNRDIMHAVAVEACAGRDAANLIGAVKTAMPKSNRELAGQTAYYYLPPLSQDTDLFRHLRLAIYANDEAEFGRLRRLAGAETSGAEGSPEFIQFLARFPLSAAWLEQLHPAIREMFAEHALRMFVEHGQASAGTAAIFQHYADAAPGEAKASLNKLLLRFDILSLNFHRARQRIGVLPESEAHLAAAHEASIAFVTGDNEAALAGFRDALKLLRKSQGKRKVALPAEAGLFHMLALLRANDPALHAELRGLIDAATMEVTPHFLAHRGVYALLELIEGRHGNARELIKHSLDQRPGCLAAWAIAALAALFIDNALVRERAAHIEAEYDRLAQPVPLWARIYAEILSKTARDACQRAGGQGPHRLHRDHRPQAALGARLRFVDGVSQAWRAEAPR